MVVQKAANFMSQSSLKCTQNHRKDIACQWDFSFVCKRCMGEKDTHRDKPLIMT